MSQGALEMGSTYVEVDVDDIGGCGGDSCIRLGILPAALVDIPEPDDQFNTKSPHLDSFGRFFFNGKDVDEARMVAPVNDGVIDKLFLGPGQQFPPMPVPSPNFDVRFHAIAMERLVLVLHVAWAQIPVDEQHHTLSPPPIFSVEFGAEGNTKIVITRGVGGGPHLLVLTASRILNPLLGSWLWVRVVDNTLRLGVDTATGLIAMSAVHLPLSLRVTGVSFLSPDHAAAVLSSISISPFVSPAAVNGAVAKPCALISTIVGDWVDDDSLPWKVIREDDTNEFYFAATGQPRCYGTLENETDISLSVTFPEQGTFTCQLPDMDGQRLIFSNGMQWCKVTNECIVPAPSPVSPFILAASLNMLATPLYQYLRFRVDGTRQRNQGQLQLANIRLYSHKQRMFPLTVTQLKYACANEISCGEVLFNSSVKYLMDDDEKTKFVSDISDMVEFVFAMPHPLHLDTYEIFTASNQAASDPVSWTLYGASSLEGEWTVLDKVDDPAVVPLGRGLSTGLLRIRSPRTLELENQRLADIRSFIQNGQGIAGIVLYASL